MMRLLFVCLLFCACREDKNYCGTIYKKGIEQPTSGYKTHTDTRYFVIMQVDSINTTIRINLTVPAWYSLEVNDHTCFELNEFDLDVYGNGDKHLIK